MFERDLPDYYAKPARLACQQSERLAAEEGRDAGDGGVYERAAGAVRRGEWRRGGVSRHQRAGPHGGRAARKRRAVSESGGEERRVDVCPRYEGLFAGGERGGGECSGLYRGRNAREEFE